MQKKNSEIRDLFSSSRNKKISIVIPARNEEKVIKKNVHNILSWIDEYNAEIVIVNDHSIDKTENLVKSFQQKYDFIRLVNNTDKPGFGNALKTGFRNAVGDYVLPVMADMCDEPADIPKMLEKADEGYDLVCASRYMKGGGKEGGPRIQGFFSQLVGRSLRFLTGIPTSDVSNAYKLYRKEILSNLKLKENNFAISMEAALKFYFSGCKITEIPTTWYGRQKGKSKFRLRKTLPYIKLYFSALSKRIAEVGPRQNRQKRK
jgi:dolichol-phosphate mannosyltransferase